MGSRTKKITRKLLKTFIWGDDQEAIKSKKIWNGFKKNRRRKNGFKKGLKIYLR